MFSPPADDHLFEPAFDAAIAALVHPRVVQRAISKYLAGSAKNRQRGPSRIATINVEIRPILTAPLPV